MNAADLDLRNRTYAAFVSLGRAPEARELGPEDEVLAGWRRLHDAHALVLQPDGRSLRMANPFSAVPTPYRVVTDGGREWFANCAWDAFGICAALGVDGRIDTACPDCGDPIVVEVRDQRPDDESLVFHCLVPASSWWDDIAFT